jgi:hypothetical protein
MHFSLEYLLELIRVMEIMRAGDSGRGDLVLLVLLYNVMLHIDQFVLLEWTTRYSFIPLLVLRLFDFP